MPEIHFHVRWPDGQSELCYSPSTVVLGYFSVGETYPLGEFMRRADEALSEASERVRARYGFACSSALDQLRVLQQKERELRAEGIDGPVEILSLTALPPKNARQDTAQQEPKAPGETYPVVIIGGGQAGLSMSRLLKDQGIAHLVLEKHRLGHSWRSERWDSFCLVTPNWQCRLPGYSYAGSDPRGFMVKDEIVEFLESYAQSFDPPLREGVEVLRVSRRGEHFVIETSSGPVSAQQVVVATGGYHTPKVPAFAAALPDEIQQLHSRDYRSPQQLPPGDVLVVGSGQSGCQIAEDLLLAGRKVHLAVGDAPRCARRYRGKDVVEWLELMGHYDIPIEQMPDPDAARAKTNHYVTGRDGGRDIDLREFSLRGMSLYGSALAAEDGVLQFADNLEQCLDAADDTYRRINKNIDRYIEEQGLECEPGSEYRPRWTPKDQVRTLDLRSSEISSIIWSIGFAPSFDWLELPVLDERGAPVHRRGVSTEPGLYFLGLPWLHTWGSGRFCGVARDAEYLLERVLNQSKVLPLNRDARQSAAL